MADLVVGDARGMLGRDDNSVDTQRNHGAIVVLVLDGDLRLGVWAQPREDTVAAEISHTLVELVGKHDAERHELFSFVGSIAEHDTLVTRTNVFDAAAVLDEALGDIGRLLLDGHEDIAGLVVEALVRVIVADALDRAPDDLLEVDVGLCGDFTEDHDHSGFCRRFACNLGHGVFRKAGIKNSVGDLIADLVRVTLADGFGSEKKSFAARHIRHG